MVVRDYGSVRDGQLNELIIQPISHYLTNRFATAKIADVLYSSKENVKSKTHILQLLDFYLGYFTEFFRIQ